MKIISISIIYYRVPECAWCVLDPGPVSSQFSGNINPHSFIQLSNTVPDLNSARPPLFSFFVHLSPKKKNPKKFQSDYKKRMYSS